MKVNPIKINQYHGKYSSLTVNKTSEQKSLQNLSCISLPDFKGKYGFYTSNIVFKGVKNTAPVKNDEFYADTKVFSKYLHKKIEEDYMVPSTQDIQMVVDNVKDKTGADEKTVRETIARLVQFSSPKSFDALNIQFLKDDVRKIHDDLQKFSTNGFVKYVSDEKGQIIPITIGTKTAVFADDSFLDYYEYVKKNDLYDELENEDNVIIYVFDGWNGKIDGKEQIYSMFGMSDSLENITINVINEMQKTGKTFDDIFNKETVERAKKLFGKKAKVKIFKNELAKDISNEGIKNLMTPVIPTEDEIESLIDIVADGACKSNQILVNDLSKRDVKILVSKYFDNMFLGYSPKKINDEFKNMHKEITNTAKRLGYNPDKDIMYCIKCSHKLKSFDLMTYQYLTANGIDKNKAVRVGFNVGDFTKQDKNKLYVIIDDFSGSGDSLISSSAEVIAEIGRKGFKNGGEKGDILIAPILMSDEGYENLKSYSNGHYSIHLLEKSKLLSHRKYLQNILKNSREYEIMRIIEGKSGYSGCRTSVSFPFSNPDNNSDLGFLFGTLFQNMRYATVPSLKKQNWGYTEDVLDIVKMIEDKKHGFDAPLLK